MTVRELRDVAECSHPYVTLGAPDEFTWCNMCGALHMRGQWYAPHAVKRLVEVLSDMHAVPCLFPRACARCRPQEGERGWERFLEGLNL